MKTLMFRTHSLAGVLAAAIVSLLPATAAGQPSITNATLSTGAIALSGVGGTPDGTYWVLTSPDASIAVTNWSSIATNSFDSNGDFSSTNPIVPGLLQSYFAIEEVADGIDFSLFG